MTRSRFHFAISTMALAACCAPVAFGAETPLSTDQFEAARGELARNGDIAWMLGSSGLVLLMVPGLALFYGGMVRQKNVLATMMQSMVALSVVGVYWIAVGYCLAFGESRGGWIGWSPRLLFLSGVEPDEFLANTNIPIYVHVLFQGMFAIITPALISGAIAERIRFGPYLLFLLLWTTFVYCPLAHWVWAMNWWDGTPEAGKNLVGLLGRPSVGALDFAGGTVVHIAAGFSGLAAILVLRKRIGYPDRVVQPVSMVLTILGAGLLWFGWFGFNGGSALGSNTLAASAVVASQAAAAAAGLSWMLAEWLHKGKPTALGLASGMVAGLVAVTPASGFVYLWGGLIIGLIAGIVCYAAVCLKPAFKYDDSLDAFGVHGVGGFLGALLTAIFCYKRINASGADGLLAGGGVGQFVAQLGAAFVSAVIAFAVSFVLVKLVDAAFGFVTDQEAETQGLDQTEHGEVGFHFGPELEPAADGAGAEPRPASVPPNGGKRYSVIVDGVPTDAVHKAWLELSDPEKKKAQEFEAIYPFFTTVQGNRFKFRGGLPDAMQENLQRLLQERLAGKAVRTRLEP